MSEQSPYDNISISEGGRFVRYEWDVNYITDEHWEPYVYVYKLPNVQHEYFCSEVTHHHAPTVEDVLREFADEVWNRYCNGTTASDSGIRELEAEYAAKLRLAGDE